MNHSTKPTTASGTSQSGSPRAKRHTPSAMSIAPSGQVMRLPLRQDENATGRDGAVESDEVSRHLVFFQEERERRSEWARPRIARRQVGREYAMISKDGIDSAHATGVVAGAAARIGMRVPRPVKDASALGERHGSGSEAKLAARIGARPRAGYVPRCARIGTPGAAGGQRDDQGDKQQSAHARTLSLTDTTGQVNVTVSKVSQGVF